MKYTYAVRIIITLLHHLLKSLYKIALEVAESKFCSAMDSWDYHFLKLAQSWEMYWIG